MNGQSLVAGPVAIKYRDLRRISITSVDGIYHCPRSNGYLPASHVEFVSPAWTYEALLGWPRSVVEL